MKEFDAIFVQVLIQFCTVNEPKRFSVLWIRPNPIYSRRTCSSTLQTKVNCWFILTLIFLQNPGAEMAANSHLQSLNSSSKFYATLGFGMPNLFFFLQFQKLKFSYNNFWIKFVPQFLFNFYTVKVRRKWLDNLPKETKVRSKRSEKSWLHLSNWLGT